MDTKRKKEFLDGVKSLYELERWANENDIAQDPDVNLKRIQLLSIQ